KMYQKPKTLLKATPSKKRHISKKNTVTIVSPTIPAWKWTRLTAPQVSFLLDMPAISEIQKTISKNFLKALSIHPIEKHSLKLLLHWNFKAISTNLQASAKGRLLKIRVVLTGLDMIQSLRPRAIIKLSRNSLWKRKTALDIVELL